MITEEQLAEYRGIEARIETYLASPELMEHRYLIIDSGTIIGKLLDEVERLKLELMQIDQDADEHAQDTIWVGSGETLRDRIASILDLNIDVNTGKISKEPTHE